MHKLRKNRINWTLISADTYKDEWKERTSETEISMFFIAKKGYDSIRI